jgi:hypothetical protein
MVEIDTGAACNVMPSYLYKSIFGDHAPQKSNAKIRAYGNTPVSIIAQILLPDGTKKIAHFEITEHNGHPIIGRATSNDINYITYPSISAPLLAEAPQEHEIKSLKSQIQMPTITAKSSLSITIDGTNHSLPLTRQYVLNTFDGLWELPGGEYHLQLKPNAVPVQHAP